MENKICCTEEMEWNEDTKKHLHKICGWIKIFLISTLCVFGICGCHLYKLFGLDAAVENLSFLALVGFLPATLVLLGCIRSNLENCCQAYCCKECGHIHRLQPEELGNTTGSYHCPQCGKNTPHKKVPMER